MRVAYALATVAAIACAWTGSVQAQNFPKPEIKTIPTPAEPNAIPLYAGVAPGSEGATQVEHWNVLMGGRAIRNVTRPTLTPFLPAKDKATGAAVIVVPGGAYMMLSIDGEGVQVAEWLAAHGVAAFVLKYRLDPTPDDDEAALGALAARFGAAARSGADKVPPIFQPLAIADAQEALRLVRRRAEEWGVDPKRVGMVGFSAGAMTVLQTTLKDAPDARPDFVAPIYGPLNTVTPPSHPQPLFAAIAADDPLFGRTDFGLVQAWRQAGGSTELHVYQKGDHGFGMRKQGTTSDLWIDQFFAWMKAMGFLTKS
ncbi:alpha/beta hydrolase [Caulobacter segnis]